MKNLKLPYWLDSRLRKKFSEIYSEISVGLLDENGKLIKSHKQVCRSYTENFLAFIYSFYANMLVTPGYGFTAPHTADNTIFDITSTEQVISAANFACTGPVTNASNGLVVGTGAVAPTPLTRALTSKIANGVGAGQLSYAAQQCVSGVTVLGNVSTMKLLRTFQNLSGAQITVKEVGLYTSLSATHFMILMDLLSPVYDIPIGQTLSLELATQITT